MTMVQRLFLLVALLLAACLSSAAAGGFADNVQPQMNKRMDRWCGRNLVDALHLLCNGVYHQMFKKANRIGYASTVEDYGEDMLQDEEVPVIPFQGWRYPVETRLASRGVRVRRGVSDECCLKGCTVAVLRTYCAE